MLLKTKTNDSKMRLAKENLWNALWRETKIADNAALFSHDAKKLISSVETEYVDICSRQPHHCPHSFFILYVSATHIPLISVISLIGALYTSNDAIKFT